MGVGAGESHGRWARSGGGADTHPPLSSAPDGQMGAGHLPSKIPQPRSGRDAEEDLLSPDTFSSPAPRERGSGRDRSGQDRAALGRAAWEPRARRCSPGPSLSRDGRRRRRRDHRARVGGRSVAADTSGGPVGPVGPIAPYAPLMVRSPGQALAGRGAALQVLAGDLDRLPGRRPRRIEFPRRRTRCRVAPPARASGGSRSPGAGAHGPRQGAANRWSSQPTTASAECERPDGHRRLTLPPTSGPVTKAPRGSWR